MAQDKHTPGWDRFTPDAKDYKDFEYQNCRVCGRKFNVSGVKDAATQMVEAMAGRKHKHVVFSCPNAGKEWHNQALALRVLAEKTPSKTLEAIYTDEAEKLILKKNATKKVVVGIFSDYR